jgi:hypothetical protein
MPAAARKWANGNGVAGRVSEREACSELRKKHASVVDVHERVPVTSLDMEKSILFAVPQAAAMLAKQDVDAFVPRA